MNIKDFARNALASGAVLAMGGLLMAAPAPKKTAPAQKTPAAARLLSAVHRDALQVEKHANRWDKLTTQSPVQWASYDRQWNLIKPSVEDMSIKLARLESMKANLSATQQKDVQNSKALLSRIQRQTRELHVLLNRQGVNLASRSFKDRSMALAKDARQLAANA